MGIMKLSLSEVNASKKQVTIRNSTIRTILFKWIKSIKPNWFKMRTARNSENIKANDPSTDLLLPGSLCLPNLEPISDANESPIPTVIKPLNCAKLNSFEIWN